LIGDQRNIHGVKQLMGSIGLRNHERVAVLDHAAFQFSAELPLMCEGVRGAPQILAAARGVCRGH
jgi:hypothetical protein